MSFYPYIYFFFLRLWMWISGTARFSVSTLYFFIFSLFSFSLPNPNIVPLPVLNQRKLIKNVIVRLLIKSANKLPISGIRRYAFTDGSYLSQIACIFAMASGVAPIPNPQVPADRTAAMIFLIFLPFTIFSPFRIPW